MKRINWKKLKSVYESNHKLSLKALADRYHVNYGTVRNHKAKFHWTRDNVTARQMVEVLDKYGLTNKQRTFCEYYLKTYNAYNAYKLAFNCKWSTARTNAYRLLHNNRIQSALSKLHKKQAVSLHIDRSDVLRKMIRVYFGANLNDDIYFSDKDDKGRKHARAYPHLKPNLSNLEELSFGHGQTHLKLPNMEKLGEFLWQVLPAPAQPAKDDSFIRAFKLGMKKYGNGRDDHNEN